MTDDTDTDLDSRLRSAALSALPRHADQMFRRLLAVAQLLRDWREAGYSHAQIHEMLDAQGLTCRPGTLRGYVARILAADDIYRARHGRAPTTPELRALCGRGHKPSRMSPIQAIRSGGRPGEAIVSAVPPMRATTIDESEL